MSVKVIWQCFCLLLDIVAWFAVIALLIGYLFHRVPQADALFIAVLATLMTVLKIQRIVEGMLAERKSA